MQRILVVFGTTYGQTERVVRRIGLELVGAGHDVRLERADLLEPSEAASALADCDAVIVAASVLFGKHQSAVVDFVRRNAARLNALPSAFVSISGSAASPAPAKQAEARRYIDALLEATAWHPTVTRSFAGAVAYTRYNFLLRWMLRRISRKDGLPTDTSRDHQLTDWSAVARFAREFAGRLEAPLGASPAGAPPGAPVGAAAE